MSNRDLIKNSKWIQYQISSFHNIIRNTKDETYYKNIDKLYVLNGLLIRTYNTFDPIRNVMMVDFDNG